MALRPLIIGSRGSLLAIRQSSIIKDELQQRHPSLSLSIKTIQTSGDKILDVPLHQIGGKGIFIKEIEEALLNEEIDIAVHSLKDLPTSLPPGLSIGAVVKRIDARDALLSNQFSQLSKLPAQARIGTSSLRRQSQLLNFRPDLKIIQLRGNIDTRLNKLREGQYEAIILACAGLIRLKLDHLIKERIALDQVCSAIGQGALALEVRSNDHLTLEKVRSLDHSSSRIAVEAERSLLQHLGGGCQVPIAGFASVQDSTLKLTGLVGTIDGKLIIREFREGSIEHPKDLGKIVGDQLINKGADKILESLK